MNRVRSIRDNLIGTEDADDLMLELIGVLTEGSKVPQPGEFYIFVYNAKTPGLRYDQNPLVAVTETLPWGFRGINFHWGKERQYTWSEIAGGLYQVYQEELNDLDAIPFQRFRTAYK